MSERARDLARSGERVLLVSRTGRDVVKYFCWPWIEEVYQVAQPAGAPNAADVPLDGLGPGVPPGGLGRGAPPRGGAGGCGPLGGVARHSPREEDRGVHGVPACTAPLPA